jgi:hypothetical protein
MRCDDLAGTWNDLVVWFDVHRVLVLPQLVSSLPVVRLDAEVPGQTGAGAGVRRLKAVVERFEARAVYAHLPAAAEGRAGAAADAAAVEAALEAAVEATVEATVEVGRAEAREWTMVTVRVPAGGVVHELTLIAAWYADLLHRTVGMEFAYRT